MQIPAKYSGTMQGIVTKTRKWQIVIALPFCQSLAAIPPWMNLSIMSSLGKVSDHGTFMIDQIRLMYVAFSSFMMNLR